MPSAPKLRNVAAEIGHIEIAHQFNAKQFRSAYRNVRITREIAIDLESEEYSPKKQAATTLICVGRKHLVYKYRAIISHHYFLEQAPQYLAHPVNGSVVVELPFLQKLRQ